VCELTHGMAGAQHGNGMGAAWAWHAMCESALNTSSYLTPNNIVICE